MTAAEETAAKLAAIRDHVPAKPRGRRLPAWPWADPPPDDRSLVLRMVAARLFSVH